jgi:hypothetical protein
MTDGYIYCFSNPSMPAILKVGMTERTPIIRLGEANASDTWRPPTPYKIEFAKKVSDASGKEKKRPYILSWNNIRNASTLAESSFVFHQKKFASSLT